MSSQNRVWPPSQNLAKRHRNLQPHERQAASWLAAKCTLHVGKRSRDRWATEVKLPNEVTICTGTLHTEMMAKNAYTGSSHTLSEPQMSFPKAIVEPPKASTSNSARKMHRSARPRPSKQHRKQDFETLSLSGGSIFPAATPLPMKQLENRGVKRPQKKAEFTNAKAMSPLKCAKNGIASLPQFSGMLMLSPNARLTRYDFAALAQNFGDRMTLPHIAD
mmetsp:Transcript_43269/g.123800  ORF Transcript_43269/g.123800 Transcript_43269/m.123800 type:complete len:219 (-) Transcript_43269:28-684(-)